MATREEMISFLQSKASGEKTAPSRAEMIAFLENKSNAKPDGPTKTGGAVRNFVQGVSANFSDELAGVAEGAGRVVGLKGLGGPMKNIGVAEGGPTLDPAAIKQAYVEGRDAERAALAADMKAHPGVAVSANLAGAIASPVNKIAPGMSLAKGGAFIGGINALGASDAHSVGGLAKDTAFGLGAGGLVGKATQVASPLVAKATNYVGEGAKTLAERFAARAIGAERGTIKKFGMDKVQSAGRQALDEGMLGLRASADDMMAANQGVQQKAMNARKAAYDKIDEAGASTFDPLEVATAVEKKIVGGKNRAHDDVQELAQSLEPHLNNILSRGDGKISMAEAQDLVEALGQKAKFDTSRSTLQNKVAKQVYNTVRKSINEAADSGADAIGVSGLREAIEAANAKYATSKTAEALLTNKIARENGNKFTQITDAALGGGALSYGGYTGDWETAGGVMLAKKGLEKYGAKVAARTLDRGAKALLASPELTELARKSPAVFQAIVQRFEGGPAAAIPKAADAPPKGKDKWANDGLKKLEEHAEDLGKVKGAMNDPKVKRLLVIASDLKPGSRAMQRIFEQIQSRIAGGDDQ